MRIQVSRDSVAAGDDIEPHDVEFEVDEQENLVDFIQTLVRVSYLASIGGGLATWAVLAGRNGAPLAIVAEQWQQPALLVHQSTVVKSIGAELHFRYLARRDPQNVLAQVLAANSDDELATALDPYGPI